MYIYIFFYNELNIFNCFISFLRYDSLALFLQHSSIIPNSNILIIEKTKGIILGAVAQRLNQRGGITFLFNEEAPKPLNQIHCFHQLNLCKWKNENITTIEFDKFLTEKDKKNSFSQ